MNQTPPPAGPSGPTNPSTPTGAPGTPGTPGVPGTPGTPGVPGASDARPWFERPEPSGAAAPFSTGVRAYAPVPRQPSFVRQRTAVMLTAAALVVGVVGGGAATAAVGSVLHQIGAEQAGFGEHEDARPGAGPLPGGVQPGGLPGGGGGDQDDD